MSFPEVAEQSAGYAKRVMDLENVLREVLPVLEEAHSDARDGWQRGEYTVVIRRVKTVLGLLPKD